MIKKIQSGNTIHIRWIVTKNTNTILDNLSVKLFDVFRKDCPISYEITDNGTSLYIKITYLGKDLKTFGKYSLVLFNNYKEDNQNTLVFKDCFILVHALKDKLESWGDEYADNAVLVELESDLSLALISLEIHDKDDIIEHISELSNKIDTFNPSIINSSIEMLDNSVGQIIENIDELNNRIDNISETIDFSAINSSIEMLDNSINFIIEDMENTEKTLVEYFSIIDNSVNILMNSSIQEYDDSSLVNYIDNVSIRLNTANTSINDISTRLENISTALDNLVDSQTTYDDTTIKNRIADVSQYSINTSSKLTDLSTYVHNINIPESYDDTTIKNRIKDVSQYAINVSTKLRDLSTYIDNLNTGSDYDDTTIKNRIKDVSQYAINVSANLADVSSKLSDLSTYTHNLVIPESYDDTTINNRIKDVSQLEIDTSSRLSDLSTYTHNLIIPESYDDTVIINRIENISTLLISTNDTISDLTTKIIEVSTRLSQSGGGSGDSISASERYARQNYTSSWHINRELLDTSYVEFKDFVVYTTHIGNKAYPYKESDLNDCSIILRTVATGSTETDRIYLIGHEAGTGGSSLKYRVKMIVGGHETYLSLIGTPLKQIIDSSYWYSTYNTSNYMFYSFPLKVRICSIPLLVNDSQEMILFRLEN